MAKQEQSRSSGGFSRFLLVAIIALVFLLGGMFAGFYFGHLVPGQAARPAAAPGEAGAAAPGQERCTIHLRDADGSLRDDVGHVALIDPASKQALEADLVHNTTIRVACPRQALSAELVVHSSGGQLYQLAEVGLDAARAYVELEVPAEAVGADAVTARWAELGLGEAPAWINETGPEDGGEDEGGGEDEAGGEDGGTAPAIDVGEQKPMEGDLYVEIRDLVGESRAKPDIRGVVKDVGYQLEACIAQHGQGVDRVRHTFQVAIGPKGKAGEALLLQGVNDELDACVAQLLSSWDFGASEGGSFFQLKTVWTP